MTIFDKFLKLKRDKIKLNITDWYFVAVGVVTFVAITLWTITKSSIWFDEAFGAYLIRFNFWDIAKYTAADVHPPLYYWLLKLWGMLFGNTELALRSMSVFFGATVIVLGYLLVHRLFDKKVARISLIFLVLSPMLVRYSQEMRMYTLVTAIALAATYALTYAMDSKKRQPWIVYGILVGVGMWTHYFMALVWLAHWAWRADIIRRIATKRAYFKAFFSKQWILAHVIAVGLFVPWLPFFVKQALTVQVFGFWIPAVSPDTLVNFYTNLVYYQTSNASGGWQSETTHWLAIGFVALIGLLIWLAVRVYKSLDKKQRQSYRLILAAAFIPVILLILLSLPPLRPSFVDRYLIPSIVFTYIFIGITLALGIKYIKPKWRNAIVAVAMLFMTIGIANVWHFGNFAKMANPPASSNARQIYQAIVEKSGDNQPIIADSPWLFYEAVFYSTDKHPVYFLDEKTQYLYGSLDMLKYNNDHKIKDVTAFTKNNDIIWYVGLPRGADFNAPYSNWTPIQEVTYNDSITGKPAYKAVQYQIAN